MIRPRHLRALGAGAAVLAATCTPPPSNQPEHTGEGTFYTLAGMGNCSFPEYPGPGLVAFAALNETDYGNADLCGAWVRVTGPRGTVTVKVVDRCPECRPGDVDLGRDVFPLVADPVQGRVPIRWQVVSGPEAPAIGYRVKDGSSAYWIGIQATNHRNPVRSLEVQVAGGTWQPLARRRYNYFEAPSGLGPGPFTIRLTDTFGQSVVSSGIRLQVGVEQPTAQQFPART